MLAGILAGRRTQIKGVLRDQKLIAGIGNAYSDEVLHAAKMSPFRLASSLTPRRGRRPARGHRRHPRARRSARSDGLAASDLKKEKKAGLRVHGKAGELCPVCGDTVREVSFADSALQYCADLPDRRQAARRPADVPAAEVAAVAGARCPLVEDLPELGPAGQVAAAVDDRVVHLLAEVGAGDRGAAGARP